MHRRMEKENILKRKQDIIRSCIVSVTELIESIDDSVFKRILVNLHHVLHNLLSERRHLAYSIRRRNYNRKLAI